MESGINATFWRLSSDKQVQEQMDFLEEILELGKQISKESYKEFYEIGERRDEDWGE
ncbi:hypothetical protein [Bacillus sp. EB600]|uniref:hypothetical protein n=1 Tax=Bacillus sp. EB600 TaxID=2806345 RepID=UPI002109A97A|nr:hypothetical protein [Bacillus sp. EB600]MCQ6282932.1 hypothetical protein [Bacillus sp. EB600]